jgi:hypothetical protein
MLLAACGREPAEILPSGQDPYGLEPLALEAKPGAMAPRLWSDGDGVTLTWLEPTVAGPPQEAKRWSLRQARLAAGSAVWEAPRTLTEGEDFFRNWADTPGYAAAAGAGIAYWLRKVGADPYAYGIALAGISAGTGTEERRELGFLHDDGTPTEHGFVSMIPEGEGLRAFWLDGREMGAGETPPGHGEHASLGAMQLRSAALDADGRVGPSEVLDDRVCECCQTDAAMTAAGPVVAYRDRDADEVRDIAVRRRVDGVWQEPSIVGPDHWKIPGCPVNGPALAADGDTVAVAWFTAAQDIPRVQLALSADGGASFGPAILVDGEAPLGRLAVASAPAGAFWVSWLAKTADGATVRLRCYRAGGAPGAELRVAATSAQRSSGVPRLVRHGERLVVAWIEDPGALRTATLPAACS